MNRQAGSLTHIRGQALDVGDAEAGGVLLHQREALRVRVVGEDASAILHELRDERGLAAWRGAEVEHGFAGLRIEQHRREQGAGILHVEKSLPKALQRRERRMFPQLEDQIVSSPIKRARREEDGFFLEGGGKFFRRGLEAVDPDERGRRAVVPFQEQLQVCVAPACPPAVAKPLGMRPAERGIGAAEVEQFPLEGVAFAQAAAQDGIDESGLRAAAELPGQFHRFIHRRVIGDAVEPEDLVEAQAQQDQQRELLLPIVRPAADEPVERGLPADDAEDQFLRQTAIRRREHDAGPRQFRFEEMLGPAFALRVADQNPRGNFSWFFVTHRLILPIAQFQSRFIAL